MVWGWGFYSEKGIEQIRNLRYKLHLSMSHLYLPILIGVESGNLRGVIFKLICVL